jgi:hypothetical protein
MYDIRGVQSVCALARGPQEQISENMFLNEIGLRAQNRIVILRSIGNIIGKTYMNIS